MVDIKKSKGWGTEQVWKEERNEAIEGKVMSVGSIIKTKTERDVKEEEK